MRWILLLTFLLAPWAGASSFIQGPDSFEEFEDPVKEATAWAMCAKTFTLAPMEEIGITEVQRANGIQAFDLAIPMSLVVHDVEMSPQPDYQGSFKLGMDIKGRLLTDALMQIGADAEQAKGNRELMRATMEKIFNTVNTCAENFDLAETYRTLYAVMEAQ